MGTLQTKKNAIKRRADFERWRHEVALEAANEAFQASAGRLRKIWAIEKLAGNCLQKIIFEQVEKSQATEDGFQQIREVTGLTDVMDIVHKSAVNEAEAKLDSLQAEYEGQKRMTEGLTFDVEGQTRGIYHEVTLAEESLQKRMKNHAVARERAQKYTLMLEDVKRWAKRMNQSLAPAFEEKTSLES